MGISTASAIAGAEDSYRRQPDTERPIGGGDMSEAIERDVIEAEPLNTDLEAPELAEIVPHGAVLDTVSHGYIATEGPVWNRRVGYLLWSDMAGDTIYKWQPGRGTSVYVHPSG